MSSVHVITMRRAAAAWACARVGEEVRARARSVEVASGF